MSSRSTDVYTGLPYDMGFFSFVTELVYKKIKEDLPEKTKDLSLGYVTMKTNFTQIYDKTSCQALSLLKSENNSQYQTDMPEIENVQETLNDIYNKTDKTPVIKWIKKNAKHNE